MPPCMRSRIAVSSRRPRGPLLPSLTGTGRGPGTVSGIDSARGGPRAPRFLKRARVPGWSNEAVMSGQEERGRPEDEAGWIERARRGDAEAFRHLVERHRDRVYGLAYRVIGSAPEAEEAAQDAFLRAWRALPEFRGDARFSTWLHRIAVRCAYDASA